MRPVRCCCTSPARTSTWMCRDTACQEMSQGAAEGGGELGHEQCLVTEPLQDRAPYRIREREENTIEQRLVGVGARVEQRHDLCAARHGSRTINHSVDSQPVD